MSFASEDHRRSAATLTAIEQVYEGRPPPDHVEFCDRGGMGLVSLQARCAGHPLLRTARIAIRACGSAELTRLHDGVPTDRDAAILDGIEREVFRLADLLLWPGGEVLDLYRRFYADATLPDAVRAPLAPPGAEAPPATASDPGGRLRILYLGELSRSAGAIDLADACRGLDPDGWQLAMFGEDTPTAPLGRSARMTIEEMWPGDARIEIGPRPEGGINWEEHDLVVVSARFAACANGLAEAMSAGLPVLATPVGVAPALVQPGVTGWLTDGVGPRALRMGLEQAIVDRRRVVELRGSTEIGTLLADVLDPEEIRAVYRQPRPPAPMVSDRTPPVSAVVPYHALAGFVGEAVSSLLEQSYPVLEVLIVNDGSFAPEDQILDRLAEDPRVKVVTQLNEGVAPARNLGIRLARGDYVAMLDADNVLESEFVGRAVAMLECDPSLAYVTSWLRYVDSAGAPLPEATGYAPLGNAVLASDDENWDGDAISVVRRNLVARPGHGYDADLTLHEDWDLYRRLRVDGRYGAVIPALLARYRIRGDSSTRSHDDAAHAYGRGEERARRRLRASGLGERLE